MRGWCTPPPWDRSLCTPEPFQTSLTYLFIGLFICILYNSLVIVSKVPFWVWYVVLVNDWDWRSCENPPSVTCQSEVPPWDSWEAHEVGALLGGWALNLWTLVLTPVLVLELNWIIGHSAGFEELEKWSPERHYAFGVRSVSKSSWVGWQKCLEFLLLSSHNSHLSPPKSYPSSHNCSFPSRPRSQIVAMTIQGPLEVI